MHLNAIILAIPALLSAATAAPLADDNCIPMDDRFPVAEFETWVTMCGEETGYTKGSNRVYPSYARDKLCFPLPSDIRALEITELKENCTRSFAPTPVSVVDFGPDKDRSHGLQQPRV